MTNHWYQRLASNPSDLTPLADAYLHYQAEYEIGVREANELSQRSSLIIESASTLPGMWEYRVGQLQEIEQIMGFLENQEKLLLGIKRRHYKEAYNRDLSDNMIEKYASTDIDVVSLAETRNTFSLVRNYFLSLTKQYEALHYQIKNIVALKANGIEGARFSSA